MRGTTTSGPGRQGTVGHVGERQQVVEEAAPTETACRTRRQDGGAARRRERGVKPSEWSAARHPVRHLSHAFWNAGAGIAADDQHVGGYLRQLGDLAAEIVRPSTTSALLSRPSKRVPCRRPEWLRSRKKFQGKVPRSKWFRVRYYSLMRDPGIGRVLVASLHQGIADTLPTRLGFYENWLHAEGLRDGTIGLAPLYAVLSFLRQEGEAYEKITTCAGEYAAEWTVESMAPLERPLIKSAPAWLRSRLAAAAGRPPGPRQLPGQPDGVAPAARPRQDRPSRIAVLQRPRAGVAAALRVLCGRVHAACTRCSICRRELKSCRAAAPASQHA